MEAYKRLPGIGLGVTVVALVFCMLFAVVPKTVYAQNERVITVYYDGVERTVVTDAPSVQEVLGRIGVNLTKYDAVEPARDTKLTAPSYNINVYRARPVTIVDGATRLTVMSPHSSGRKIAEAANLQVHAEDNFELTRIDNFLREDNLGLKMTITRSKPLNFVLYGKSSPVRTQALTVGEFLQEKHIKIEASDRVWPTAETPITPDMTLAVYRDGTLEVIEEAIPFTTERILATDRDIGYREIKEPGALGKRFVVYQIENGTKKELHSYVMSDPKKQVEIVGVKRAGFAGSFDEALAKLRSCEGKYTSISRPYNSAGDRFYGAYQFTIGTWRGYAPDGWKEVLPSDAPPAVQDQAARNLYARRGWQPWPACSVKLGLQDIYR